MESVETPARAAAPLGQIVFAIGDIHGRRDLLAPTLEAIRDASRVASAKGHAVVAVFLGDYIDRGPASRGVMEDLIAFQDEGCCEAVFLRGNHEQILLDIVDGTDPGHGWLEHGGLATLESYGAAWSPHEPRKDLQALVGEAVPSGHIEFLRATSLMARYGDYLFVHAGLRPDRSIEAQTPADLLWLRYYDDEPPVYSAMIVHGHLPNSRPVLGRHRIGIDTMAYASGALTLLRLEGTQRTFGRIVAAEEAQGDTLGVWTKLDSAYRRQARPGPTSGRHAWEPDEVGPRDGRRRVLAGATVLLALAAAIAALAYFAGMPTPGRPNAAAPQEGQSIIMPTLDPAGQRDG